MKTGVIVTDDHNLFRKGILALLSDFDFVEVLGEAGNGLELLQLLRKINHRPLVVFLDLNMPEMDGPTVFSIIKDKYPDVKVIILSMEDDSQIVTQLVQDGVSGYLLKSADPDELELALKKVNKTGFYFSEEITEFIVKSFMNQKNENDSIDSDDSILTSREIEVLKLICKEYTATEIAELLSVSVRTVEGYKTKLFGKTQTKNIAGLALYAIKNNLIEI
ncbi:MAG: response regulator transcription factor [Prolixibacteraceae bacterium]|nr:response regulator transcription factor [Prolixibacteraceae bacterium]